MSLTCYIVDDEPLAIEVLESHIEKYDRLQISGTFQNAVKAFQALQEEPVDVLFLDIQMPGLSGIELLRALGRPPMIILTTAYREYAVEGFELDVVDYLLKPISFERFLKAMSKVAGPDRPYSTAKGDEPGDSGFFVQADGKMINVSLEDILYIESRRDYVHFICRSEEVRTRQTINDVEEKLRAKGFLRIHRSFIVPLDRIRSWSASEVEVPGTALPIGRTYKSEVMKILESRSDVL